MQQAAEPATHGPFRVEGDQTSPTRPGAHPDGCTAAPPEILRRVPAAVAARRPALPCLEGPASCRESRRGSALHVAPPGVRRRMPPQPSRSPRRRCPQGCCRRRRGRWARTRPAARNWVSKSSQGRRACGGQESLQRGGPYRRARRRGPGSRLRRCRPVSSPPPRTSRSASRSRIVGASFGRGATAIGPSHWLLSAVYLIRRIPKQIVLF